MDETAAADDDDKGVQLTNGGPRRGARVLGV